jgi:hypothetical protein
MTCPECEYQRGERAGMWIDNGADRKHAERVGAKERCSEHQEKEPKMKDWDLMPFGKYENEHMYNVPAGYLHYLWTSGLRNQVETSEVAEYIHRSIPALKEEDANLNWE